MDIKHYGVTEAQIILDPIDAYVEEIMNNGYAIVHNALNVQEIVQYANELDKIYAIQCAEVGGVENLQLINDANVVRCLLAYDPIFLQIAVHPKILLICRKILGENITLLMQNGVINQPQSRHYQTAWHRDLNYQHWVSSKPLAISALVCIDDFNIKSGGTKVLSGSHLKDKFPSEVYIRKHAIDIEAPAGSILMMDSMLFHCAGNNSSTNVRRGINHVIGLPILAQQISFPDILNDKYSDDPFLNKFLGYRWAPKKDVRQWRNDKIQVAREHAHS